MTRQNRTRMRRMAELGSDGWSIVERPFPPRLIGGTAECCVGNMDDLKPAKRKFADFVFYLTSVKN